MAGQWKEVVRLSFRGERFRDHALDLSVLAELTQFQKLVVATAEALWRAANPGRANLPPHFGSRTRLCLRQIVEGSAVAPLEVYVQEPQQPELWEPEPFEVKESVELVHEVFGAVERNATLPERFPKRLVPEYAKLGQSLTGDEAMEIAPPGRPPARVAAQYRERLANFAETPYEATAEVTGEVLEADVRRCQFQLWLDGQTSVSVRFDAPQENLVTTALKDHDSVRLRVRGRAEHSPAGELLRFTHVEVLELAQPGADEYDPAAPSIEAVLASIAAEVPQEEWDKLPPDLTDDLDHHLYGTPRR